MILYNCKRLTHPSSFAHQITKFDADLNVEASYDVASYSCTCPSFPRKNACKHQSMLSRFLQRGYIDTDRFYNADNDSWHRPFPSDPADSPSAGPEAAEGLPPAPSAVSRRRLIP